MNKLLVFLSTVLLLTSCEYSYNYSYTVSNRTDTTIAIHIKTYRIDTLYKVLKDSNEIVYMDSHGIEGSKGPYFQNVSMDLDSFTVTKNGITSIRNYLENNNWGFENGDYKTTITNGEF
jgi:hypothetical protein